MKKLLTIKIDEDLARMILGTMKNEHKAGWIYTEGTPLQKLEDRLNKFLEELKNSDNQ